MMVSIDKFTFGVNHNNNILYCLIHISFSECSVGRKFLFCYLFVLRRLYYNNKSFLKLKFRLFNIMNINRCIDEILILNSLIDSEKLFTLITFSKYLFAINNSNFFISMYNY